MSNPNNITFVNNLFDHEQEEQKISNHESDSQLQAKYSIDNLINTNNDLPAVSKKIIQINNILINNLNLPDDQVSILEKAKSMLQKKHKLLEENQELLNSNILSVKSPESFSDPSFDYKINEASFKPISSLIESYDENNCSITRHVNFVENTMEGAINPKFYIKMLTLSF